MRNKGVVIVRWMRSRKCDACLKRDPRQVRNSKSKKDVESEKIKSVR